MSLPPDPVRAFTHQGIKVRVYDSAAEMGAASAVRLGERQVALASEQDTVGFLIMAAPSAFPFYEAYFTLAQRSPELRDALARTHFFQFDDYPLPADHPASFRYLLDTHFFGPLYELCPGMTVHPLAADAKDADKVCKDYTAAVLASGPDIQLKGVGENGHWGFHEPGIPLDGDPAYVRVDLSEENVTQQLRDHPEVFQTPGDVPREAFTANVPLFLKTRDCIEDNVPQASKAFALLAAYGSDAVDAAVPSSALKRHPNATLRTTTDAAWALETYVEHGAITDADVHRMAETLTGESSDSLDETAKRLRSTLQHMGIRMDR